jgi:hypothetical protein
VAPVFDARPNGGSGEQMAGALPVAAVEDKVPA